MRKPNLLLIPYPNEDGTLLAKRLQELMLKDGLYKEMKRHASFTPRSQARRLKSLAARKKLRKMFTK